MQRELTLIILCIFLAVAVHANATNLKINLKVKDATLENVIKTIEEQTDFSFMYDNTLDLSAKVSINEKGGSVESVLKTVLRGKNIDYQISGNHIILRNTQVLDQKQETQDGNITARGTVVDASGLPLIGVSVVVKGTTTGTMTNIDGVFELKTTRGATLVVTYVGFTPMEIKASETASKITMKEDSKILDEVVVVGYGVQKKANLSGAVDQISSEVFENRSVSNTTQALQGAIPNLNISLTDGKPTGTADYNIRGTTSIGQQGSALVLIDGVEGDPSMLNPSDIASVSVLKDAASAAIFGARAAFGVVLITTKMPTKDKISISYSGNFSLKSPTVVPDLVTDGYTFAKNFNDSWMAWNDYAQTPQNINKTLKFSQEYLAELERRSKQPGLPEVEVDANGNYVYYGSTDWYDELYKKNLFANDHNVSISGNSGKVNYYASGRYYGQDGLFRYNTDDYSMYNMRGKGSIQVFDWLKIDNNTEYSKMSYHNPLNVGEGGSIWRNLADEGHPLAPMFNPDGTLTHVASYGVGDFWYGKNGQDSDRRIFKNTASARTSFLSDKLRVNADFTYQTFDNNQKRTRVPVPYSNKQGVVSYVGTSTNDLREIRRKTQYISTNVYAEYEDTFAEKHYFKGMIGHNYEQSTYDMVQTQRNGLLDENTENINLALGQNIPVEGGYNRWKIVGGFFRLNYGFDNRYLLEVNGRVDGSSKFPSNEQYGFFPSVSAAWRVFQEPFAKEMNKDTFTDLKFRASYGSLGNGNIKPYQFMELFKIEQSERALGGVRPQFTRSPNVVPDGLTWETSTTFNVGLDLVMLSDRLTLTADYFVRKTKDMFTPGMSLPKVFGTDVPKGNYADMTTKGYEISINWMDKFNLNDKPFSYNVRLTLSDYQSTIDKYNNPLRKLEAQVDGRTVDNYYKGQKVGDIWGYVTEGFFTSEEDIKNHANQSLFKSSTSGTWLPGDIKFKDLDGSGVIDYGDNTVDNPGDKKVIGNTTPRYAYSINLGGEWNNFFFSTFFQGVGKRDWYPGSEAGLFWGMYNRPYNDIPTYHLANMWTEDNTNAYFPRHRGYIAQNSAGTLRQPQTKYLQNAAYIRMKNIQIGYNIPKPVVSKIGAQQLRVYLSGENLWSWSPLYKHTKSLDVASIDGSDRDLTEGRSGNGYNYPILKSFTLGVSVTF